jgi:hypothetical protein
MELMSMVDFVLQQDITDIKQRDSIVKYANFLKQPLKLEMFFPCDEDGNILNNPFASDKDAGSEKEFKQIQYNNSKEKVLFENTPIAQAKWLVNTFSTIESLSDIINTITPIYLTESAIKQIGL